MMNSRPTRKPEGRGPFRKLRRIIARVVAGKPFLITVSALAAVVCWSALVASDGTLTRQKTFANVAVTVTGEAALKSRGYIVMDDILEKVPAVKMTVEVTQANYNRVSGTAYNPHFDLSQITGEGENELSVTYYSSQLYGPVVSCEPASITVNVERYITRRVPVVLEMTGTIPEGLYLDSYKTDPTTLSVSGPQSLVASVARVVARLDQSALSERRMTDRSALNIELQDSQGNVVVSDKLEITNQSVITNSVVVETELVPMKNVPLEAQSFVTGKPAEGYELTAIELAEETVPVAARQELLDAIDALTTDSPLNIGGATEDVTGYVRLKKLTGVENTLPTEIGVTARISEKQTECTLRRLPIQTDGLADHLTASLSTASTTAQRTGGYTFINALDASSVHLFVDVSGLEEGVYTLPVQIHIDNAPEFTCALSSPEVTVTLQAKP